jgi:beta-phosphoglucomutase-like phosphatase (HAD superfamily)
MRTRAVTFDFNGTLSHDESILSEIYVELFAEYGRPVSAQEYFDQLAGRSDEEIVSIWFGGDHPAFEELIGERVRRYRAAVADGSTVTETVRAAVRYAAERVPLAIVTGAVRIEVEPVVEAAGLADSFRTIVTIDDVGEGKPRPVSYLRALEMLGAGLQPEQVVAFEDTDIGIASAKAAGLRCLAVLGTLSPARLAAADEIVPAVDVDLMQRLLTA